MKPKFTGGNWKVGNYGWCVVTDNKDAIKDKRNTPESVSYYGGALICESCRTDDANIIAAVPDMFNAIKYYLDVLKEVQGKDWDKNPDHVLSKMINAIKKANG